MKRKPFVCANWKLHHLLAPSLTVLGEMIDGAGGLSAIDLVVAPVTTLLFAACDKVRGTSLQIAAQNVFHEPQGAFTGEWSVAHLRELGCTHAIVGHSERRQYFGDNDESVSKKVKACLEGGVTPIACVGETLEQRKRGEVESLLKTQVDAVVSRISPEQAQRIVIAYEPVWAIGTGLTASAEAAQQAHHLIRQNLSQCFDKQVADQIRIIYGGSVKSDNIAELVKEADIDGALIGGASLSAASFLAIAQQVAKRN